MPIALQLCGLLMKDTTMTDPNLTRTPPRYILLDLEFQTDHSVHRRFREIEQYTDNCAAHLKPHDPLVTPRWPCTRIVCASWMILTTDADGHLTPTALETRSMLDLDEKGIVSALFANLYGMSGNDVLVTWAGEYRDLANLRIAAAEHGLKLPKVLSTISPFEKLPRRQHLDLLMAVRGGADMIHLQEYAARLGIPCKILTKGNAVWRLAADKNWLLVEAVCETDVIATAMILARHLFCHNRSSTSPFAADMAICSYIRQHRSHQPYRDNYNNYASKIAQIEMIKQRANFATFATID